MESRDRYSGQERRRTRVVFPSSYARTIWSGIIGLILSWAAWISGQVVDTKVLQAKIAGNCSAAITQPDQRKGD